MGFGSSSPPQLGQIDATNYDGDPHTVHVLLLEGSEPVYWASKRVPAASDGVLGSVTFEGFPTDRGEYVLHVRSDERERSEWEEFDVAAYDASCLGIQIEIGGTEGVDDTGTATATNTGTAQRAGTDPGAVSIWYTTDSQVCASGTTTASE
jgi:hypothetical protein